MDTQVADPLQGALVDGRYRVRARLARRDAATVYVASDERLGRPVLLRLADPGGPAGGATDGSAAARLVHPNVVGVYDRGEHDGVAYLVTEHVRARTLRELLVMRERLAPAEALAIMEQMLAGLAAAHHAGVTHGDLTPERIMVIEAPSGGTSNLVDSVVKVDDFSLMRPVPTDGVDASATAAYVAPELVTDGRADARGDVYSAGIVLFEMLTGRVPYEAATPAEVAWQHVNREVPPPSRYAVGIPAVLDDLVATATRREPADRPTDAGAMLAEVHAVRDQVAVAAATPPADATVVMSSVRGGERPPWARLPEGGAARGGHRRGHAAGRQGWAATVSRRTVLVSAGAALGLLLMLGAWWIGFGRGVPVPDLVGLSEQVAVAEVEERGLVVQFADPQHSDEVPVGQVLAQDPDEHARVDRGGTITLTLSLGPEVLLVPDVVGAQAEVARNQLESVGLVWQEGEPGYSDTVPEGRVLAVDPPVGTELAPNDTVVVSLSRGRAPVEVPSVIQMHLNQASNVLQQAGLQAEVVEVESTRPAGEVVNQDPAPGSGREVGDTVRLEVSKGPPTVPVPEVMGRPCGEAEQILQQAGFQVHRLGDGQVAVQNPSAGTGLPPGSDVVILCA
jgi:serine/threonine-protein kinase